MMVPTNPQNSISVPVTAIARETRCLDRNHRTGSSLADRRQHALEARPAHAAAGAPEVIVDHLDAGPAELARAIGKPVLPALAFLIVHELIGRRLPNVHIGAACEMLSGDLAHRRPPRLRA